jgi:hypothetical protein
MKPTAKKPHENALAKQVGKALKRAAKTARKLARMHGTTVSFIRDGKIVSKKP